MSSSEEVPQDADLVFPTQEGGAVPAGTFFGEMQHYLVVMDLTGVPTLLCDPLMRYLTRYCFEFFGSGKFSVWNNNNSIAISAHTVPGKMDLFFEHAREAVRIFTTNHIVRINRYSMTLQRPS